MVESSERAEQARQPALVRAAVVVLAVSALARLAGSAIDLATNPALGIAAFPADVPPRAVAVLSSVFRLQFVVELAVVALVVGATVHFRRRRNWARVVLLALATIEVLLLLVGVGEIGMRLTWGALSVTTTSLALVAVISLVGGVVLSFFPDANAFVRWSVSDAPPATTTGSGSLQGGPPAEPR